MIRFAIVFRVFDGEAPYLQSFIDYHRRLGVDSFCPVVAPGAPPLCREISSRNGIALYEWDDQRISSVRDYILGIMSLLLMLMNTCILICSLSLFRSGEGGIASDALEADDIFE